MKVGLYTTAFHAPSITHGQVPPETFSYWYPNDDPDCLLATAESEHELPAKGGILWRQEARWLMPKDWESSPALVLSADKVDVARGAVYLPFVGTWLKEPLDLTKTGMACMIASAKATKGIEGYAVRKSVRGMLGMYWPHGFGRLFGRPIEDKGDVLGPYRFSIAVESQKYPWYHSEKLFDCFAAKAVPLYWGCDDFTKLTEWGYDPAGILPWTTPEELAHLVGSLSVERYEAMRAAIHANYERTKELYCTEVALEKVLREALCLA
jgi:hypothetical protein